MSVTLRPYQLEAKQGVYKNWETDQNVMLVLPTGGGKTKVSASIVHEHNAPSVVIAHRQELVSQLSLALASEGVKHRIIGPDKIIKLCVSVHMAELGQNFVVPNAPCAVAGVNTLIRRKDQLARWLPTVSLWLLDESHHLLQDNVWGKAVAMFPNAKGLGVTATPMRADGKGLGRHADGLIDSMVLGPTMRELIDWGYLTKYRVFAPPSDLNLEGVKTSADGDYNRDALTKATRRSHVMGDVVTHYLKIAKGLRGVTFATDVQSAKELAEAFNLAGVPAIALDATTPDADRVRALRQFRSGEILQVVNVDLFGEGFDLPAISVVSMARATQSYGMYVQIFGRALRLLEGKEHAIIIDHVGNVVRHGLPDAPRTWSLDRRDKRASSKADDVIPVKACPECTMVYERVYPSCPFCGFKPEPAIRKGPEFVDGDLYELDEETLNRMRQAVAEVDKTEAEARVDMASKYMPLIGQMAGVKRHKERQVAQSELREEIAQWMGYRKAEGDDIHMAQRRFYLKFGVDVLSAQALGTSDAIKLKERLNDIR